MQGWIRILLVSGLLCAVPAAAQYPPSSPAPPETGLGDDGWETESYEQRAAVVLKQIAGLLGGAAAGDLDPWVARDSSGTGLGADGPWHELAGGFRMRRSEGAPQGRPHRLSRALRDLVRPFRGPVEIDFHIVSVEPGAPGRVAMTVHYEARGRDGAGLLQQLASWRVEWTWPAAPGTPRLLQIVPEWHEEIARQQPLFADRTSRVLREGSRELRRGAGYWRGRLDALGGVSRFGHHGIAIGDADGDGREDLYVAMTGGLPNRLYLQQADGTLVDVAEQAGVAWLDDTKGVLFADIDNDGDRDLLLALGASIIVARNAGDATFGRFLNLRAPTDAPFYSISVADYDLDGDLDIFGARYVGQEYGVSVPLPLEDATNGPTNHLLRNDGERGFRDVTSTVGLSVDNQRFSLIGTWADVDDDGDPDLYVTNDFGPNQLFRNDGGSFVEVAAASGVEDRAAGMGAAWSDFDLDGDLDLHVTNMFSSAGQRVTGDPRFEQATGSASRELRRHSLGNSLFRNDGGSRFEEISDESGIRMGRWGWGGLFADLNGDGADDLVVPNGFVSGPLEDDL